MSGSPVLDASGHFVGALRFGLGAAGEAFVGLTPAEAFDSGFAAARRLRLTDRPSLDLPELTVERLRPGRAVIALNYWGDVNGGVSGMISDRRGDWIAVFGHDSGRPGTRTSLALAFAPVVGRGRVNESPQLVSRVGAIVGELVYEGLSSSYGVVGRQPSGCDVDVEVVSTYRALSIRARFTVARNPLRGRDFLWQGLSAVLQPADGTGTIGPAKWTISRRGQVVVGPEILTSDPGELVLALFKRMEAVIPADESILDAHWHIQGAISRGGEK